MKAWREARAAPSDEGGGESFVEAVVRWDSEVLGCVDGIPDMLF
jgi:hypothetical protein